MQKHKNTIMLVIAFVLVAGLSFYGGMQYGQGQGDPQGQYGQFSGGNGGRGGMMGGFGGMMGGRGNRNNGGFATGQILSKDSQSITLKLMNGGSKIIFFSPQTAIMKAVSGVIDDLTQDQFVTVTGTPNSDGSINAESIQIRPAPPAGSQNSSTQQSQSTSASK